MIEVFLGPELGPGGDPWSDLAPLVMTELERPDVAAGSVVPRDEQPYLNPGLLSESHFASDVLAGMQARIKAVLTTAGRPSGSAQSRACVVPTS